MSGVTFGYWTVVREASNQMTESLRIPGGWLYRTTWFDARTNVASATSMCFQPERAE
jgi:hypothetical protein